MCPGIKSVFKPRVLDTRFFLLTVVAMGVRLQAL